MATKKKIDPKDVPAPVLGPRPRMTRLIIKNFRCIGSKPITIDLDDIVVLVGPNNVGKSSVLKAYEIIMSEGSNAGELSIDDFFCARVNPEHLPEIELHTVVYDNTPGTEWIENTPGGEMIVRERWTWAGPGKPVRRGYNVQQGRWATDSDAEKVPWGAAGVANTRRPEPHRAEAFASPDAQAAEILKLLMAVLRDGVKALQAESKAAPESDYAKLLSSFGELQKQIVTESREQIAAVEEELTRSIERIFPGNRITFDARPEEDIDKAINWFKSDAKLLMGPTDGYMSTIGKQGSGARRTLLWTAIRLLAETVPAKKATQAQRPHVLLIDEPEMCLHPSAIRDACDLLYGLPGATGNWQVMVTTHSPCFIDFARDHTSIVRVERTAEGDVVGTTIFRPEKASFTTEDREQLKLLNLCDPYVAEFFFGGHTILVEGDTEYTAFKYLAALEPTKYARVHIVRARGKATIVSLQKILNQFGTRYAVLHDSDVPLYIKDGKEHKNPAWSHNEAILVTSKAPAAPVRVLASVPNFEVAYFGEAAYREKPYNALARLKGDSVAVATLRELLDALVNFDAPVPTGALEWGCLEELHSAIHGQARPTGS